MLQSIQQRYGEKLRASDGEIGHVRDFYFDDKNWTVRYVVADTGGWLSGRLVLISPHALGHLYPEGKVLLVNLSRQQIEDSPSIDEHKPVSRQHEEEYHRHYGYAYYAESMPLWGLAGYPVLVPPPPETDVKQKGVDSHLRSARFVAGYNVEASDGVVGEVIDFLIDGRAWVIREIVVECGHWYSGKKVVVSTDKVPVSATINPRFTWIRRSAHLWKHRNSRRAAQRERARNIALRHLNCSPYRRNIEHDYAFSHSGAR